MSNIIVMNNNMFGDVRFLNIEGKPYAVANDVAKALGYANCNDAIKRHCKGVAKHDTLTNGGKQELNVIPESDIYRLIIKSKLPKAQEFERWVMEEVLPQIRQTGGYIPIKESDTNEEFLARALLITLWKRCGYDVNNLGIDLIQVSFRYLKILDRYYFDT